MHALGFERSEEYADIVGHGLGLVYAGPGFFEWVIANNRLNEVPQDEAVDGDLAMYFNHRRWTDVGRLTGRERAISKWGLGLLYEHGLSETPELYGDEVRFFPNPGPDASIDIFVSYANSFGIQFEEDSR